MFRALKVTIVAAACVIGGPALAQTEAPAEPAAELTDQQKVQQCLVAVTNAGSDPRACVGVVADPCLEGLGDAARDEAAVCMERETAIWAEHLDASVKELGTLLGDSAPEALAAVQESWVAYREKRCNFGNVLYPDSDFSLIWRATCLLEETGRRAVELGGILKEARARRG